MTRNRLTEQAIANIKAAKEAKLEKNPCGWQVKLASETASVPLADKANRPVVYPSKEAAKRALGRHNDAIEISVKAMI